MKTCASRYFDGRQHFHVLESENIFGSWKLIPEKQESRGIYLQRASETSQAVTIVDLVLGYCYFLFITIGCEFYQRSTSKMVGYVGLQ